MSRRLLKAEVLTNKREDHLNAAIAERLEVLLNQDIPEVEPLGIAVDETGTSTKAVLFKVYREVS